MPPPTLRNTGTRPITPIINNDNTNEPTLKQLMTKLNDIIKAMEFNSSQQEEVLKRLANMEAENKILRDENNNLNKRLANIEGFFYQQQQQQLQNHITIHGIPKKANEVLHTTIINTIKTIDITINTDNIKHARRMNVSNNNNNTTPPIIVVEINDANLKQQIMQKYKSNGPIMLNQISNTTNTENKKIYFNEYLNNYYKQLYTNAKELKTSNNFKYIWFKNGTIHARKTETSQIYRIKHQNDIIYLQNQQTT